MKLKTKMIALSLIPSVIYQRLGEISEKSKALCNMSQEMKESVGVFKI